MERYAHNTSGAHRRGKLFYLDLIYISFFIPYLESASYNSPPVLNVCFFLVIFLFPKILSCSLSFLFFAITLDKNNSFNAWNCSLFKLPPSICSIFLLFKHLLTNSKESSKSLQISEIGLSKNFTTSLSLFSGSFFLLSFFEEVT